MTIQIKALPCNENQVPGFNSDYMARIRSGLAKQLAGMYPMPRDGEFIVVAVPGLELHHRNGAHYLAHPFVPVFAWPTVFRIEVIQANEKVAA